MTILLKLFQNTEEEETLPNSIYKARIILTPKPDKNTKRMENYRPLSLINKDEKFSKNTNKQNLNTH